MEYADTEMNKSPYKVIKMLNGDDVLCKVLQEYSDALVVECPMSVTRQHTYERPDHIVEHTGLQRWVNFTNDVKFVINKEKILGWGNLAPEVIIYYRMISNKAKEESGVAVDNSDEADGDMMDKIRANIDRLATIMEQNTPTDEELMEIDDDDPRMTHTPTKKILH
jgi:hypothetical protein